MQIFFTQLKIFLCVENFFQFFVPLSEWPVVAAGWQWANADLIRHLGIAGGDGLAPMSALGRGGFDAGPPRQGLVDADGESVLQHAQCLLGVVQREAAKDAQIGHPG